MSLRFNTMNSCDHGHSGAFEVRVLPIGGGGNVIICHVHYLEEIAFRKERNKEVWEPFDLPTWKSLKVYDPS